MPRTCFVIMPFSATQSCTEEEWTWIFQNLFKPAIEGAGLGYECRRSQANRGNIVAKIIRDLNDSYVLLADLTDRNANVFYELGVRHALKNRSIILAQKREDLPFDLQAYASHVYDWKTEEARARFVEKIRQLLEEIDTNPERPDNPVSDFLGEAVQTSGNAVAESATPTVTPQEVPLAQSLIGSGTEGLDVVALTRKSARSRSPRAAKVIYRLTKPKLLKELGSIVDQLNQKEAPGSVKTGEIPSIAREFISVGEPIVVPLEQFALTSVEENWKEGVVECLSFAGDLITLSERPRSGRTLRFASGLPALLAWRLIILMGAKALAEDAFDLLTIILRQPIEVEESGGRFSHRSFLDRRNLFYAESFLGYADHSITYIRALSSNQSHLRSCFESEESYHFQVAEFLIVVALADAARNREERPLYPGYRLLSQAGRAMSALCSRLANMRPYREAIAKVVLNENGAVLQEKWSSLVSRANSVELGSKYFLASGPKFPIPMDSG